MRIPILTFGAFASILTINSVMADTTVTSKQYVDTTRQATIPATGTNAATPGTTVVTYTNTAGTLGERGIFNPEIDFNFQNNTIADGHEGDLLDAGSIFPALIAMDADIQGIQNNLVKTTVTYKTCYQEVNGECILWNLTDKTVYGERSSCSTNSDCGSICSARGMGCGGTCQNNSCVCYQTCA